MIIIRMSGGLGNQMFMYSFARSIQCKTNEKIYISRYCYRHLGDNYTKREFALNCFRMRRNVKILPYFWELFFEQIFKLKRMCYQYKNIGRIINNDKDFMELTKYGIYQSDDMFRHYKKCSVKSKMKFVDGFFMSWKYFDNHASLLRKDFCFRIKPSQENAHLLQEIEQCNAVCVHIRLGDYLSKEFKKSNYLCTEDYFIKAMDEIYRITKEPEFYIFSTSKEDIAYIKNNFPFRYPVKYVELGNVDYEELRLMATCKHFILSNSSFSWWAQYLSTNKAKVVVAPSRWQNNQGQYTKDLYQEDWLTVEV